MSTEERADVSNVSEFIAENFGANATYVESLLARWQSDPSLVDESWRAYFEELVGPNGDRTTSVAEAPAPAASAEPSNGRGAATAPAKPKPEPASALATVQGETL